MAEWLEYKLADVADVTMGQSPKSEFYNTEGNGMPFLQGNRTFGRRFPTFDTWTTNITKQAKAGDVIMSVRAPVGDLNITPVDMCLGRGVCGIRMKNGKQDFLYYLMEYSMPQLLNKETGTIFGSVNRNDINGLTVLIPDEITQDKVTAFLKNIDDKIENNNAINRNLSEQCDAIYRERFVTNTDTSWTEGHLSDLITVKYGKDHKKLDDGKIPCYGSGGVMRYVEKPLYDQESVLIPRKGTLNNVMYVSEPFWSVDTMFFTMMKIPNVAKFVFHFVKEKDLAAMNAGSAVPSMTTDILNAMELIIPSPESLADFEDMVQPLYKVMKDNEIENKKLAELRDALLPKLMSGELDVSDLDI